MCAWTLVFSPLGIFYFFMFVVREDTLLDMVSTMILPEVDRNQSQSRLYRLWRWIRDRGPTHGVGLVHQMPFSMDREEFGFPACLEKVGFCFHPNCG